MVHIAQDLIRIENDLVAGSPLYVGDKTHAATILLEGRIIKPIFLGKALANDHNQSPLFIAVTKIDGEQRHHELSPKAQATQHLLFQSLWMLSHSNR